jgi:hypothetical protein
MEGENYVASLSFLLLLVDSMHTTANISKPRKEGKGGRAMKRLHLCASKLLRGTQLVSFCGVITRDNVWPLYGVLRFDCFFMAPIICVYLYLQGAPLRSHA